MLGMETITRSEAKAAGLKRYYTGKPCPHGHVAERQTSDGGCCKCKRERGVKWYADNRDKACALSRRHRAANPEKVRVYNARYRLGNPEKVRELQVRYRAEKSGKVLAREARYRSANKERIQEQMFVYVRTPEGRAVKRRLASTRRSRELQAIPSWYSELDELAWQEAAHLAVLREAATGFEWHADHMIPLACKKACGLHVWNNVQVIPGSMNNAKRNKLILTEFGEWIRHI